MKATLKDVVFGTPTGKKAMEVALKKSCDDQVKLLEEVTNGYERSKADNCCSI
jgi:hypothetical protein